MLDALERHMNLPARQQRVLDHIEQALHAADPGLQSMFAKWTKFAAQKSEMPGTEIVGARLRPAAMIAIVLVGVLIAFLSWLPAAGKECPGLSSDQVVASAAVRQAACHNDTNAWSKGAR
jgi:hypothetical protein